MLTKPLALALVVGIATLGSLHAQQQASPVQPPPVKRTVLQKAEVPGTNLEMIYATVEIAPGFKAGRHFHPGLVMAQVLEGEFWFQMDGESDRTYRAGDSLTVPSGRIHNEGAGPQGVRLSAVYVLEKGKPLASPAP